MSVCKGCGKEIVWGKTADGGVVPLDPRAPVYAFDEKTGDVYNIKSQLGSVMLYGDQGAVCFTIQGRWMVSHFATCPKANNFSGKNKKQGELIQ